MKRRDLIDELAARMLSDAISTGNRIGNPTAYRAAIAENLELENTDAQLQAMLAGYAERDARESEGQAKPKPRQDPVEAALAAYRAKLAAGAPHDLAETYALDAAAKISGELDQALERRVLTNLRQQPPAASDDALIAARYQRIALAAIRHPALAQSVRELCGPDAQPSNGFTTTQLASIVRLLEQTAQHYAIHLGPLPDPNDQAVKQILDGALA